VHTAILDQSGKLDGRRKLVDRSYDLYDNSPNDPLSSAQQYIYSVLAPSSGSVQQPLNAPVGGDLSMAPMNVSTPQKQTAQPSFNLMNRFGDNLETTPRSSVAGSPAPDGATTPNAGANGTGTPAAAGATPGLAATQQLFPSFSLQDQRNAARQSEAEQRDTILPVYPLDEAILLSVTHGARDDDRKTRDFLGGIMVVGGASQVPGFTTFLEQRLKDKRPGYTKEIMIGVPPRELDPQVVVWKGGSVFGKLRGTNDSWIGGMEYDRLGSRLLAYKCMFNW
jgi:actin-related protein 8